MSTCDVQCSRLNLYSVSDKSLFSFSSARTYAKSESSDQFPCRLHQWELFNLCQRYSSLHSFSSAYSIPCTLTISWFMLWLCQEFKYSERKLLIVLFFACLYRVCQIHVSLFIIFHFLRYALFIMSCQHIIGLLNLQTFTIYWVGILHYFVVCRIRSLGGILLAIRQPRTGLPDRGPSHFFRAKRNTFL